MPRNINYIFIFIALVISQAVIFNNLILFNSAVALVFVYLIIELPITLSVNALLAVSFLLGLSVDVFQDTPGLNALSCTIVAMLRRPVFYLYVPHDDEFSSRRLCINTLGTNVYLKYMLTLVLIYCIICFTIEAINYTDYSRLLWRIISSTLYTFVVIYAIDSLTLVRREKRL